MPLYFAYGSCMDEQDLARTVKATKVGVAMLNNYRLGFTRYSSHRKGGVADVIPSKGEWVEGNLFEVPNFKNLDIREGAPFAYTRKRIRVRLTETSEIVWAYTYVVTTKSEVEYRPSKEYAKLIWNGARSLSVEYRLKLKANLLDEKRKKNRVIDQRKASAVSQSRKQNVSFIDDIYGQWLSNTQPTKRENRQYI